MDEIAIIGDFKQVSHQTYPDTLQLGETYTLEKRQNSWI
jgi:hypothetical protein